MKAKTIFQLNKLLLSSVIAGIVLILMLGLAVQSQDTSESLFKGKCGICHGADASGKTTMGDKLKIPDLRSPEIQKKSDAEFKNIIGKGKDKMPAYETKLSAAQIDGLVVYIRDLAKKR